MFYTTYFSNVKNLPPDVVPISIAAKPPAGWTGLEYKKLAPNWSFFSVWRETQDNDYYIEHFKKEILDSLNILAVVRDLCTAALIKGNATNIALVCYESPDKFCHRHLVSEWLNDNGFICKEFIK